MTSGDNNEEEDTFSNHGVDPQPDIEASAVSGESIDKNDTPPDKDLSHWSDHDEVSWQLLEEFGYRNNETSGNFIYNCIVEEFALVGYPDRMDRARVAAIHLKFMFRRCAQFGEIDFEL